MTTWPFAVDIVFKVTERYVVCFFKIVTKLKNNECYVVVNTIIFTLPSSGHRSHLYFAPQLRSAQSSLLCPPAQVSTVIFTLPPSSGQHSHLYFAPQLRSAQSSLLCPPAQVSTVIFTLPPSSGQHSHLYFALQLRSAQSSLLCPSSGQVVIK
ncbi:hypothetical protein Bpfe_031053 [Biomphalaria pfeifferi]|uniref:Uncharacterized protein n=1 Tax=Biomphalaria pfeifferi TaxID=112525 RepID=A0AAD8APN6_BIOPF|nr:hypothetical protein Bpfe_031053 [Biomphalaria pfeifferi]